MSLPNVTGVPGTNPINYTVNPNTGQTPQPNQPQQPAGNLLPAGARPVTGPRSPARQVLQNRFNTLPPVTSGQAYVIDATEPNQANKGNAVTVNVGTDPDLEAIVKIGDICTNLVQTASKARGEIAAEVDQNLNKFKY